MHFLSWDISGGEMVSKLDKQAFTSGFESHWVSQKES